MEVEESNNNNSSHTNQSNNNTAPKLKFRNYVPRDPELKKGVIKIEEDIVKDVKAQFAKFGAVQEDETLLLNVAPKKANWDLQRDIEKKMDRLEKQTLRAIADIVREKLKDQSN
jgi:coiled-coil domain-containing protein 12